MGKKRREPDAGNEGARKRYRRPRAEDLQNLSANIRFMRDAVGWAQDRLADEATLARSHISALEKAQFDARLSTLGALADAFKRPTVDLLFPANGVLFGGTASVVTAKAMIAKLDPKAGKDSKIDWTDPSAVTAVWGKVKQKYEERYGGIPSGQRTKPRRK